MNEDLLKLEAATRASPEYTRARGRLVEREHLEQQLHALDHELDLLAAAGKLARIDRLRELLLTGSKVIAPVG